MNFEKEELIMISDYKEKFILFNNYISNYEKEMAKLMASVDTTERELIKLREESELFLDKLAAKYNIEKNKIIYEVYNKI